MAKLDLFVHKGYINNILFSQNYIIENALIQLPLSLSLFAYMFFSPQKIHFSYFKVILWPFESAHPKYKFRETHNTWPNLEH